MEESKKEKAIAQAIASLKMDRIYIKAEFLTQYRKKHKLPVPEVRTLTLRRSQNNGSKS